jgi:hypothetical protein
MAGAARRGGIPGPESRTGLVRPTMTEAEFERRQATAATAPGQAAPAEPIEAPALFVEPEPTARAGASTTSTRTRGARVKPAKPRRIQRMFALEEELDKKLWLYAIHVGKDRSEVINDLLRPVVASMVLYDSRDRRSPRSAEPEVDRAGDGEGGGQ